MELSFSSSTLILLKVTSHSEIKTSRIPWRRRAEQATANVSCSKSFFLVTLCTQTMFSMLVFMCRDPGDATSKVSCCVQTSYCFKHRDFDASVKVPVALPLKMSLTWKQSLIVIMLLHEHLTRVRSQKDPRLQFGESFTLSYQISVME